MINLDEIIESICPKYIPHNPEITSDQARSIASEAIRQALELAANEFPNEVVKEHILNIINKVV